MRTVATVERHEEDSPEAAYLRVVAGCGRGDDGPRVAAAVSGPAGRARPIPLANHVHPVVLALIEQHAREWLEGPQGREAVLLDRRGVFGPDRAAILGLAAASAGRGLYCRGSYGFRGEPIAVRSVEELLEHAQRRVLGDADVDAARALYARITTGL